jgi:hypothetical protein
VSTTQDRKSISDPIGRTPGSRKPRDPGHPPPLRLAPARRLKQNRVMAIDREKLRSWVYDCLVQPPLRIGAAGTALALSNIEDWVKQKAQEDGLLRQNQLQSGVNLDKADEDAIRECIWSLVIQGVVVPGSSNQGSYGSNLPWLQITDWGKTCLEKGEYVPYDTGLYLSRLRAQIPSLDSIIDLYLREALNSFRSGNYLAVAVMVGVASERILIVLRDAIRNAMPQEDRRASFTQATDNQSVKRIHEALGKRIDPLREQLPGALQESIGTELDGIFDAIRRTRNDAGHPTGRAIEREEAYALLQLFPVYAKCAYALIDWLTSHPV